MVGSGSPLSSLPLCGTDVARCLKGKGCAGSFRCRPDRYVVMGNERIVGYCLCKWWHQGPSELGSSYMPLLLAGHVLLAAAFARHLHVVRGVPNPKRCDGVHGEYSYQRSRPVCDRQSRQLHLRYTVLPLSV